MGMRWGIVLAIVSFFSVYQSNASSCRTSVGKISVTAASAERITALRGLLLKDQMIVSGVLAAEWAAKFGISIEQLMVDLASVAKERARPPISKYLVGVVARGISGNLYLGVNLEFEGHPLNSTVHGEQFAISLAFLNHERSIVALALSAPPCGHCRQWLNETKDGKKIKILIPNKSVVNLARYLPNSFGPANLGITGALLAHKTEKLFVKEEGASLFEDALIAAGRSYAPYSNSSAGIALRLKDDSVFLGSYLENAAFNPSLSPLQVALVGLVAAGRQYNEIEEALLIEGGNSQVSHEAVTRSLLATIAPHVELKRLAASSGPTKQINP